LASRVGLRKTDFIAAFVTGVSKGFPG